MDTGLNRDTIDKFYTKPAIVKLCLQLLKDHINIQKENDLIIEPSAGNGAFITGLQDLCKNCVFYDIQPEENEFHTIQKQDYLTVKIDRKLPDQKIHVIGNPPFGRQSCLAKKFITKSCEFADTISFILPKSFKKNSMQKAFTLSMHLISQIDLPSNSFLVNGQEYDVPCIFQIWIKKTEERDVGEKLNPVKFQFVKKEEDPDISFRRVGVNAGNISKDIEDKSIQSHYFIKFVNQTEIEDNLEKLKNLKFDTDNTVGPKSIGKQELIAAFNKLLIN